MPISPSLNGPLVARRMDEPHNLRVLFHKLNNQLGIMLAHAELIAAKATDEVSRARAGQVVTSALDAMGTAKEIRLRLGPVVDQDGGPPA